MSVRYHENRRSERTLDFDRAPELGGPQRCGLGLMAWRTAGLVLIMLIAVLAAIVAAQ